MFRATCYATGCGSSEMAAPNSVAFLVGAGLAVDAGLPHSVDLAVKLKEHLQGKSGEPKNVEAKALLDLLYFILGGIRFQWGRLGLDPDQPVNIEQIATAALRLRHRHKDPLAPYVSSWSDRILALEEVQPGLLERFSELIFARLKEWLATPPAEKINYISRMADMRHRGAHVSIFSLNYDLLAETALQNIGEPMVNGFKDGRWNPMLFQATDEIRLYKLHGSLDWVDDEMHGICSLRFDRHPKAEDFEVQKPPLLIFGTDSKLTGKDPFLSLVHAFSDQLRTAQVLVVIGYSFSDQYINDIIEQRMRDNVPLRLILASPRADDIKQSRPFLENSPRVKTINEGAEDALNSGKVHNAVVNLLEETKQEAPF